MHLSLEFRNYLSEALAILFYGRGGVDSELFKPQREDYLEVKRPVFIYTGRVSVEKNLRAFLDLELPGTKVVVGDGPEKDNLASNYPDVIFTGYRHGKELALTKASADVFVFPSLTDTFGVVLLEAMACGVPVATYPVRSPWKLSAMVSTDTLIMICRQRY
jgi:glycosyltransferase involved in cell wall biosynthesis